MRLLKTTLAIALATLCSSCQNDEETIDLHQQIQFSSNVVTVAKTKVAVTKAAFAAESKFQIVVRDNTGTAAPDKFDDITLAGEAGTAENGYSPLTVTPTLYWDDVEGRDANLALIGIYKNNGLTNQTITDNKIAWTINADQSTGIDAYDLITAYTASYAYANPATPAQLAFEHRLTKVTIALRPLNESGEYTFAALEGADITFHLPVGTAPFNVVNSALDLTGITATDVTPCQTKVEKGDANDAHLFTVLAYPCEITANAKLATIDLAGNSYDVVISSTATTLGIGEHNVYNVTIKKSGVVIKAGVKDWDADEDELSSFLVAPGAITIGGTENATLSDGATMTMKVTGSGTNDSHTGKFIYTATGSNWNVVTGYEVYWDDIKRPVTKVEALLITKPKDDATGEHYFVGTKTYTAPDQDITSTINLGTDFFTRPLCKIDIIVKTSDAGASDRVNIKTGIQKMKMLGCGTFKVADDGVSLVRVVSGDGDVAFPDDGSYVPYKEETKSGDEYICSSVYILPYATARKDIASIEIKEKDADTYTNTYFVNLDTATTLEAGKHYTYTVTITKTGAKISASLTDWVEGTGGNINTEL